MEKREKRIIIKSVAIAVFLILLYVMLPYIQGIVENPPGTGYIALPENINFKFERDIWINATGTYTLNITIPTNSSFQKINVDDESNEYKDVITNYNRTWWRYSLKDSTVLRILYTGETKSKVWDIKNSLDVDAIPSNLKSEYDHDEYIKYWDDNTQRYEKKWVIEPDEFKGIGNELTKGKKNVVDKLRAIYDYMVKNFQYETEKSGIPKSAARTWNDREGDCDELSFVFISIARSVGIPAWIEYGLLYTQNSWGAHAWVGTVVPTGTNLYYVNIDITTEVGRVDYGRGFLIRDPYRITEWREDGNSEHLSSYYQLMYGHYTHMNYEEKVKILSFQEGKKEMIPLKSEFSSWLMIILIVVVILAIFIVIIKV